MQTFNPGDRVVLLPSYINVSYIKCREHYTNMYAGKTGTVLCETSMKDKVCVEFDDIVFTHHREKQSSHDHGCYGRGKLHYCWFIPKEHVELLSKKISLEEMFDIKDTIENVSDEEYYIALLQ